MAEQFMRIATSCRGRFRRAHGPEAPRLFALHGTAEALPGESVAGGAKLREELLRSARQPDVVLRFLAEMDRKLDAILAQLRQESLQEVFPFQGRILALSGTDLALESAEALAAGDCLEVLLVLEEFPLRLVSVLGRVEGVLKTPDNSETGAATYAVVFLSVEEEDRETIIRHVFSEERKRIRQRKGEDL